MYVIRNRFFDAAGPDGSAAGSAAAAAAGAAQPAAAAAGAAGPGAQGSNGAPGAAAAGSGSLMARGAAAGGAGAQPAAASAGTGDTPAAAAVPEKYLVKNEDGTPNWEASALKQAQGYAALSQRLGAGDAPPQSADDYKPELPQGVTLEALKSDPKFAGFLKGAHAVGLNNKQVSYLLGEYQQRMQMMGEMQANPAEAEAELRKAWQTDQQMEQGLQRAYRAAAAFSGDADTLARLDKKFGNDPDYLRLMANIGKELGEDKPVGALTAVESDTLESLMGSEAYANAKHADHARTVARVKQLYAKRYPD